MIQATLFNYFNCNNASIKLATHKIKQQLKQTSIKDYFSIKPKKKAILDYFKLQEGKKKIFDLVLVDIHDAANNFECSIDKNIACIKKNMYDQELKYIAISYRWGKLDKQLVETPDYVAHVTSFDVSHLEYLCTYIQKEPDLKEISYLWIDAISVDQRNNKRKREAILQMSEIYKRSTYILAVPDLHLGSSQQNAIKFYTLDLIAKYNHTIYEDILNNNNKNKSHEIITQFGRDERKRVYRFFTAIIEDWWNRVWVISECLIAKEKEKNHGIPLKYMFINLLHCGITTFFSYPFDHQSTETMYNNYSINSVYCDEVVDSKTFIEFLKTRCIRRTHLDMLLNSNASRNSDRFSSILPHWNKYNCIIKNKYTVSRWGITSMTSVRLKLYGFMDDLWDKARLLYACSKFIGEPIIPSYASQCDGFYLQLVEKDDINGAYIIYTSKLSRHTLKFSTKDFKKHAISELGNKLLYTENLTDIQLNPQYRYLSIKAKRYFINKNIEYKYDQRFLSKYSLRNDDGLRNVYIPFYTFAIPGYTDLHPTTGSSIILFGNIGQNRWIIISNSYFIPSEGDHYDDIYTFNIY